MKGVSVRAYGEVLYILFSQITTRRGSQEAEEREKKIKTWRGI